METEISSNTRKIIRHIYKTPTQVKKEIYIKKSTIDRLIEKRTSVYDNHKQVFKKLINNLSNHHMLNIIKQIKTHTNVHITSHYCFLKKIGDAAGGGTSFLEDKQAKMVSLSPSNVAHNKRNTTGGLGPNDECVFASYRVRKKGHLFLFFFFFRLGRL